MSGKRFYLGLNDSHEMIHIIQLFHRSIALSAATITVYKEKPEEKSTERTENKKTNLTGSNRAKHVFESFLDRPVHISAVGVKGGRIRVPRWVAVRELEVERARLHALRKVLYQFPNLST